MQVKKSLVLFAVLMLLAAGAVVQANVNLTGYPIVDEPITLEIMGRRSPIQPAWEDMGFFNSDGREDQHSSRISDICRG